MNVKQAIDKIAKRKERAQRAASRCREKGLMIEIHLDEYTDKEEMFFARMKKCEHYLRSSAIENYVEELDELMIFLKSKDQNDEAAFTSEEEMEDKFGIYGDSDFQNEEWSNTVAFVTECRNSGDAKIMWVICMYKSLKDI